MSQFPNHVCEVCGTRKHKQGNWFLVAQEKAGSALKILHWSDMTASQAGFWTLCSPAHVERFVNHWLSVESDSSRFTSSGVVPGLELTSQQEEQLRESLNGELYISRAALVSGFTQNRQSALSLLDTVEAMVEGYGSNLQTDLEEGSTFDA